MIIHHRELFIQNFFSFQLPLTMKCVLFIMGTCLLVSFVMYSYTSLHSIPNIYKENYRKIEDLGWNSTYNKSQYFYKCDLPMLDPWDPVIKPFVDMSPNPISQCKKERIVVKLQNKSIIAENKDWICKGRCVKLNFGDTSIKYGGWHSANEQFYCDFVQVECTLNNVLIFQKILMQIVEKPPVNKSSLVLPNIYILLIDSVSPNHLIRSMPKTIEYFEKSMRAITFRYLNKVGANSWPNAQALWLGILAETIDRTSFRLPILNPEIAPDNPRKDPRFIFNIAEKEGYKTLFGEDWKDQTKNILTERAQHYMRPLILALHENSHDRLKFSPEYYNDGCLQSHHVQLEYLSKFISSYPGNPKFGWLWLNNVTHDDERSLHFWDDDFFDFFRTNREKLNDSFVILMSDHGPRFGPVSEGTEIGMLERNNPMFSIAVPKRLRKNEELIRTLRENSLKLQTHFDVRSTLIDIMQHQPESHFTDRHNLIIEDYGSSFLRYQTLNRTCLSLPIPLEYCLCPPEINTIVNSSQLARDLGSHLIDHINGLVEKKELRDSCVPHSFKQTISATILHSSTDQQLYLYSVIVQANIPSSAVFKALIKQSDNQISVISTNIERLDKYRNNGKCAKEFKHLCHCKRII